MDLTWLTPDLISAYLTLTLMEIVLGVDNIIFIAILVSRLPKAQQFSARTLGLVIALVFRILLLMSLNWVMGLTETMVMIGDLDLSGRDLLLIGGGGFLLIKATLEIHQKVEGKESDTPTKGTAARNFWKAILQITLIDIVFSFDSIITAVGMTSQVPIMIAAVITSMFIMIGASGKISDFIDKHPTIKILALAFLLMIGVMLMMEAMDVHAPRGYLYFAMFFSFVVEILNMRYRKNLDRKKS